MNLDNLPVEKLLAEALRRIERRKIYSYLPFGHPDTLCPNGKVWKRKHDEGKWFDWSNDPWQLDFHAAGAYATERMLRCANRVGKTLSAAAEVAMHLTGEYPDWWEGYRFKHSILCWAGAITNETNRDIVQKELLGGVGELFGTGMIPGHLMKPPQMRQAGVSDVVDSVRVKHVNGKHSTLLFKTYDQGWLKWQGAAPDCIAEGQRVMMADGRYIPIEDVTPGDLVLTVNSTGKRVARRVLKVFCKGERDIVEARMSRGPWLRMTADHKVYSSAAECTPLSDSEQIWQVPSEWEPDPLVSLPKAYYAWLGLVISEGTTSQRKITMGNESVVESAAKLLPSVASVRKKVFNNGHVPDWHLNWPDFWALVYSGNAHEKVVPDWVFMSSNDNIALFLGYLFAGDGWAHGHGITYASTSRLLAEQVSILLWRVGIRSTVMFRRSKKSEWRDQWWVTVSASDSVVQFAARITVHGKEDAVARVVAEAGKRIKNKSLRGNPKWARKGTTQEQRLERYRLQNIRQRERYAQIREVKPAGKALVYDLTVEEDHRFVAGLSVVSNCVWLDEEPDDMRIFTEARTRLLTTRGRMIVTFTPLQGQTELVDHFQNATSTAIWMRTATWNDVPHLSPDDKRDILESYPDYEREARSQGVPMMGEGRIFTTGEDDIKVQPFKIPAHWARIKGIDFGVDHPATCADIAWDRDTDTLYVTRTWRKSGADVTEHSVAIEDSTPWVPISWPHDGTNREKSNGKMLKDHYVEKRLRMLSLSARYDNKKGGGQPVEPILVEVQKRMADGRFKVFSTCTEFFDEMRTYHRKDGKIVAKRDDVLKAVFYGVMMRRFAISESAARIRRAAPESAYTKAVL